MTQLNMLNNLIKLNMIIMLAIVKKKNNKDSLVSHVENLDRFDELITLKCCIVDRVGKITIMLIQMK